eukprot:5690014-Pyramimonas_sp.AAC.1
MFAPDPLLVGARGDCCGPLCAMAKGGRFGAFPFGSPPPVETKTSPTRNQDVCVLCTVLGKGPHAQLGGTDAVYF